MCISISSFNSLYKYFSKNFYYKKPFFIYITKNIYCTITGKVKDGEFENMNKAIEAMVVATRTEDGAISYDFWLSDDDTTLYIHERYKDSEATLE